MTFCFLLVSRSSEKLAPEMLNFRLLMLISAKLKMYFFTCVDLDVAEVWVNSKLVVKSSSGAIF